MTEIPKWHNWVERLQTIARAGLTYSQNTFDLDRYQQVQTLAAEILAEGLDSPIEKTEALLGNEQGYATPKLDVRGVVFKEGKILMVKEVIDGEWTLPGGWVDVGEPPSLSAEREVWEESGYEVRAVKLLALYDHRKHDFRPYFFHIYKLFFLCELLGGQPTNSIETNGVGFFGRNEIPSLSNGRITKSIIERMFELAKNPAAPTDFD